jgi:3-isopropylmalate/(R)-2-methylmalate dehydratase small subunit
VPSLGVPLRGRVWKLGDSVDTGQLAGGGVRVSDNFMENLKANCLRGTRPEFNEQVQPGDVIVAGSNFGLGSSRPIGVVALQACGIAAVVAESVSRLYRRNCVAQGLPAFALPGVTALFEDGDEIEIDYEAGRLRNLTRGGDMGLPKYPQAVEEIYEAGGIYYSIAQRLESEGVRPAGGWTLEKLSGPPVEAPRD